MTSVDRLPSEILLQILRHVDEVSLRTCISVSKNWQSPVTQLSYEEISLQAYQVDKIKDLFEDNLCNKDDYFDKLHWTKRLIIRNDTQYPGGGCKLEQQEFTTLMSYLPNVQEIDLKGSHQHYVFSRRS